MSSAKAALLVRLAARVALLSLVFQLSAIGHWSLGPFHAEAGDISTHAAHCHGDVSGCAGESSLTGSLLEANLTPAAPEPLRSAVPTASLRPRAVETALIENLPASAVAGDGLAGLVRPEALVELRGDLFVATHVRRPAAV